MSKKPNSPYTIAIKYLKEKKGRIDPAESSWSWIAPELEKYAGTAEVNPGAGAKKRGHIALRALAEKGEIVLRGKMRDKTKKKSPKIKKKLEGQDLAKAFYRSYAWRKVRMEVLVRDGRMCACCNARPEDGLAMHVDHIKPLRLNWGLRLDIENLQVLCEVCNHGKGNWDETDWRKQCLKK